MFEVTESADNYLASVVEAQDAQEQAIVIRVTDGGTPRGHIDLGFMGLDEMDASFVAVPTRNAIVKLYTAQSSVAWLEDGRMDMSTNDSGSTIMIDAPNLRIPSVSEDSPLEDRINYVLAAEVNPGLRSHGGMVSLVDVVDGDTAVLQFGGGCQGCGMVDMTLKHGVEKTLVDRVPELVAVRDVTDHEQRENAYYR